MENPKEGLSSVKLTTTALCILALSGCISPQMKTSMDDYGQVFSDASNRQLLLNLARMDQGHPPYFFQMGQISAYYTVSGNLGGGAAYPSSGPWSASGTIGASASHSPTFTFVPLSGNRFSEQWLKPIAPEILSALVQQGFPVDVLLRLCVQSIDFDLGRTNANGNTAVSQNSRVGKRRNLAEPENRVEYAAFLRDCGLLKDLQDMGALELTSVNVSEPLDDVILRTPPSDAQRLQASEKGAT